MTDDYLIDTNHMGLAIRQVSLIRDRIQQAHLKGARFITCVPVLCELEVGIQQTAAPEAYRERLRRVLKRVRLWPIGEDIAEVYGEIYLSLKKRGRVLSQVDLLLAAMAKLKKLTLLTTDQDFLALPEIRTDNWTS